MLKRSKKKAGQSTLEYVILVVIVIAALLSIQMYLKRGIQGRARSAADDIGEQYATTTNWHKTVRTNSAGFDMSQPTGAYQNYAYDNTTTNELYNTRNMAIVYTP
jgi:uncharacterized protein (UPF0333 family)